MAIPEQYRRIIGAMHRLELLRRISIRDSARGIELHRTQMPMLEYIATHDGCAQADVSKHLHVSPPPLPARQAHGKRRVDCAHGG